MSIFNLSLFLWYLHLVQNNNKKIKYIMWIISKYFLSKVFHVSRTIGIFLHVSRTLFLVNTLYTIESTSELSKKYLHYLNKLLLLFLTIIIVNTIITIFTNINNTGTITTTSLAWQVQFSTYLGRNKTLVPTCQVNVCLLQAWSMLMLFLVIFFTLSSFEPGSFTLATFRLLPTMMRSSNITRASGSDLQIPRAVFM